MADHHERCWRRNQMELALWRYAVTSRQWGADGGPGLDIEKVPMVFRSRVKKMLNMDRIPAITPWRSKPGGKKEGLSKDIQRKLPGPRAGVPGGWVFFDQAGEGTGSEDRFSTLHVFLMGVALDLMNIGLKQAEIVFFLKHTRPVLQNAFDQIHRRRAGIAPVSGSGRQKHLAKHYPDAASLWVEPDKAPSADFTAWMLVQRFETKEIHPPGSPSPGSAGTEAKSMDQKLPLFMEPRFFFGLEAVKEEIFDHLNQYRHVVMVELADAALTLPGYLRQAPAIGKGRPVGGSKPRAKRMFNVTRPGPGRKPRKSDKRRAGL